MAGVVAMASVIEDFDTQVKTIILIKVQDQHQLIYYQTSAVEFVVDDLEKFCKKMKNIIFLFINHFNTIV